MNRTPVQIGERQRVCVLVHKDTKRILTFCLDDPFAKSFEGKGYVKHILYHAADYDRWAKRLREQSAIEDAAKDAAYLEREDRVRQHLRKELRQKLLNAPSGAARKAIESALHCLDYMEDKKKRYRAESFMVNEGYDAKTNVGEELVHELIDPKPKVK
jgi:hypothetical protein